MQVVAIVLLGLLVCASHVFIGYTAYRLGISTEKLRWLKKANQINKDFPFDSAWLSLRDWILADYPDLQEEPEESNE